MLRLSHLAVNSTKSCSPPMAPSSFQSDMTDLLRYLTLETFDPVQQYWIELTYSTECSAISLAGISPVSCADKLPLFCSQSAPYRPNTETDTSTEYQVEVSSGNDITMYDTWSVDCPCLYSGAGNITALAYGSPCTQIGCLYLEEFEASDVLDPQRCVLQKMFFLIVVSLSTIGFLALQDGVTNGYGIADQITALRWVSARTPRSEARIRSLRGYHHLEQQYDVAAEPLIDRDSRHISQNLTDTIIASGLFPIQAISVATDGKFRYVPLPATEEYPYGDPNLPYFRQDLQPQVRIHHLLTIFVS
ncbi:hypothetical protein BS17DRAFT_881140 [Gyrodon lividus]|nr:hypothetical protein BS17DRAFT_881140 [Gyrodon lividus]